MTKKDLVDARMRGMCVVSGNDTQMMENRFPGIPGSGIEDRGSGIWKSRIGDLENRDQV